MPEETSLPMIKIRLDEIEHYVIENNVGKAVAKINLLRESIVKKMKEVV